MTSEQFRKTRFTANTMILYQNSRNIEPILCYLCEVDFDEEILTVISTNVPDVDVYDKVQVNIKHCEIYDKKIRKLTKQ